MVVGTLNKINKASRKAEVQIEKAVHNAEYSEEIQQPSQETNHNPLNELVTSA